MVRGEDGRKTERVGNCVDYAQVGMSIYLTVYGHYWVQL